MPTKQEITARMQELAGKLSYPYRDISHLARAMYCRKQHGHNNYTNDAMATLGDAVLKLIWSEHFFSLGLDKDDITRKKADMENNGTLKNLCDLIGAQGYAYNNTHFAADAPAHSRLPHRDHDFYIEAIIAAIYLDLGLEATRSWVLDFWKRNANAVCSIPCAKIKKRTRVRKNDERNTT